MWLKFQTFRHPDKGDNVSHRAEILYSFITDFESQFIFEEADHVINIEGLCPQIVHDP